MSIKKIAEKLGRDKSTIYREIKRNAGLKSYRPEQAHEKATKRLKTCHKYTKMTSKIIQQVEKKTRIGDWEGDLIIGKDHKGALVTLVDRYSKKTKICF